MFYGATRGGTSVIPADAMPSHLVESVCLAFNYPRSVIYGQRCTPAGAPFSRVRAQLGVWLFELARPFLSVLTRTAACFDCRALRRCRQPPCDVRRIDAGRRWHWRPPSLPSPHPQWASGSPWVETQASRARAHCLHHLVPAPTAYKFASGVVVKPLFNRL